MPRQSVEAKAAAIFRSGGKHPQPPKGLGEDERKLWREIVECRPIDFFQPGALHLLEQLCVMTIAARRIAARIQENPADAEAAKPYLEYAQRCAMHCTKLRLTIQTEVDRKSGQLDEREPTLRGESGKRSALFGANVVRL